MPPMLLGELWGEGQTQWGSDLHDYTHSLFQGFWRPGSSPWAARLCRQTLRTEGT